MQKKTLIIGAGFNALATAYHLKKLNQDVKIIFEKNIKGVLGSVEIEEAKFDLGYQFFDGLDKESENFVREMFQNEDLFDFKYGASTYSNNQLYEDHAIPYWASYGKVFVIKAFIFYFYKFLKSFLIKEEKKASNLEEMFNSLPPNIRHILNKACKKHYQLEPYELETIASEMSTFTNYRQTLFNDHISNFLKKKSIFFDEHLASRRKSNPHLENISLYPKGKNMEFITDKLIDNLKKKGVIFENSNFDNIDIVNKDNKLHFKNEKFDQTIITTNIENIKRIFKLKNYEKYEQSISQIFIYFTVKDIDFSFQYTQVNDLNLYCSRISNCSLYSKLTNKKNHVIISEIPLTEKNKLWYNDNLLIDIAWNEIIQCGIIKKDTKYLSAKVLKVPKTFNVPKVNFFKNLGEIETIINEKFLGKATMIGQGIFTRHKFIKELHKKI